MRDDDLSHRDVAAVVRRRSAGRVSNAAIPRRGRSGRAHGRSSSCAASDLAPTTFAPSPFAPALQLQDSSARAQRPGASTSGRPSPESSPNEAGATPATLGGCGQPLLEPAWSPRSPTSHACLFGQPRSSHQPAPVERFPLSSPPDFSRGARLPSPPRPALSSGTGQSVPELVPSRQATREPAQQEGRRERRGWTVDVWTRAQRRPLTPSPFPPDSLLVSLFPLLFLVLGGTPARTRPAVPIRGARTHRPSTSAPSSSSSSRDGAVSRAAWRVASSN